MFEFSVFSDVPNSGGKKFCHRVEYQSVEDFAAQLRAIPAVSAEWNPWWGPHCWRRNHRLGDDWVSSSLIAFDLDYEPSPKQHIELPDTTKEYIILHPPTCGSVYHLSPRGVRIVFCLDAACYDKVLYSRAARGVRGLVQAWLDSSPALRGLAIDPKVYKDFARLIYPPNGVISGVRRTADVVVLSRELFGVNELAALDVQAEAPVRPVEAVSGGWFADALENYNRAHARDWGAPGASRCPVHPDAGSECFGRLPADPTKWCCWSDHHSGVGQKASSAACWTGDAADIDAYLQGISVYELVTGKPAPAMTDAEAMKAIGEWVSEATEQAPERVDFVKVRGEELKAVEFAERILASRGVYSRGGRLCRVVDGKVVPICRDDAVPLMNQFIRWFTLDAKGNRQPWDPTEGFSKQVLFRSVFQHFKPLDIVSRVPVLLADGSFVSETGYDDKSGIFFWPDRSWGPMPKRSSRADAEQAVELLWDLVADFPFEDAVDRSTWLAGLLTPLCRRIYKGNTPLFIFTSTTPGSGKTLLVQLISVILTGEQTGPAPLTRDSGEFQKELLSALMRGSVLRLYDNVTGEIKSPPLEAVLTSGGYFTGRILGASQEVSLPVTSTFYLTGNNVQTGGDLYRRVLICSLAPKCVSPEYRSDFKIADIIGHAVASQVELYTAAARMIQAWLQAGAPQAQKSSFGSFEPWSMVRDILMWLGCPDPLSRVREQPLSQDREAHEQLIAALSEIYPYEAQFTVTDCCSDANFRRSYAVSYNQSLPSEYSDLFDACALLGCVVNKDLDPVRLGIWLRDVSGRVCESGTLKRVGKTRTNRSLWAVVT